MKIIVELSCAADDDGGPRLVLLETSGDARAQVRVGTRGLLRNPTVLSRMWQFVERPERHPVLLYYWCRCAVALLLSPEGSGGLGAAIS